MAGTRKDFNRQETQKHIRRVFLEMYSETGIDGITVNALCSKAGIVKSTFYSYFDDKYSVLEEIEQELLSSLADINSNLETIELMHVVNGYPLQQASDTVDYIHAHLEEFRVIMGPHGDPSFENRWRRNIAASFTDSFAKVKSDAHSAGLACAIFSSTLLGIYRYFIFEDPDISKRNFALILGNTFKYALLDFQSSTSFQEAKKP